uniref:TFIIS N-terminal domain-containing protein n=1 Tax=Oryza rufipogon TaxID=4529 RepID=A0A0E0PMI1_ORYRU
MADRLDRWRELLRGAAGSAGICDVIENAILVAAADAPQELLRRRDRICEILFTAPRAPPCHHGCGSAATPTPATPVEEDKGSVRRVPEKQSKVDSSSNGALGGGGGRRDDGDDDSDSTLTLTPTTSASAAPPLATTEEEEQEAAPAEEDEEQELDPEAVELEALTNEIDEESQVVGEVLRIKDLFLHKEDHSDATLFESLRRLQLMQLSVSTLKATEIGRAVNGLRKHNSQQIRHLVRTLIEGWKILVDEWVSTTNVALTDNSPGSSKTSVVDDADDEGLPSPPLDEGAFFATQTTAIQLSEVLIFVCSWYLNCFGPEHNSNFALLFFFLLHLPDLKLFDEMDEDGNLRHNNDGSLGNKRENNGRRPTSHPALTKQEPPRNMGTVEKVQSRRPELARQEPSMRQANPQTPQNSSLQVKQQAMLHKQSKPLSSDSGPGRPLRAAPQQKPFVEMKSRLAREQVAVERKPAASHVDKSRLPAQPSAGVKLESAKPKIYDGLESNSRLEAAKRRLQERYQEAENAKRQRTIQVMELGDIPKPKHQNRQPMMKSRNHIRSWANGRR